MSNHTLATFLGEFIGRLRHCSSLWWQMEARLKGVEFQGKAVFLGRPMISLAPGSRMLFGDGVRIHSSTRANPLGLAHPCALRALASGAQLILGSGVGLSGAALCAGLHIEIGEGSILGAGAMVIDNDFHQPLGEWGWSNDSQTGARAVKVGRGVFIGARAIILKGVTIGDRAIIGAGAVVTRDVPPRHVATGNPANVFQPKNVNVEANA